MSDQSWIVSLKQIIQQVNKPLPRIAIVGIGHELRGDDAAGLFVARGLQVESSEDLLVVDAGPAPENFIGKLCRFAPDVLLLVDAVHMNEVPGTIRLLKLDAAQSHSATTHTLSIHLLAGYLQEWLGCNIVLLGLQPGQNTLGAGLSDALQQSVDQVVWLLSGLCR